MGISSIYINDSNIFVGIIDEVGIWRAPLSLVTGINQREVPAVPTSIQLGQNYPNPFNPTTQIAYSVPKAGLVTLDVYNVLGQKVATLFSGMQQPGNYTATFNGSRFASGVYFYRLQAGGVTLTKKLVMIK